MHMRMLRLVLATTLAASAVFAATPGSPQAYSSDALPDFEPTITTARNAAGTTATITVAIKQVTPTDLRNEYVVKDSANATFKGYLPTPAAKPLSVDPYLYPNQYSTGVAPYRLYCVGIVSSGPASENAITVWRSDDVGRDGFAALPYTIVDTGSPKISIDATHYEVRTLDKPTIVVNGYGSYRGYVYVAYLRQSAIRKHVGDGLVKTYYTIYVSRSTNGGTTFETPVAIWTNQNDVSPRKANAAHVITANGNGYVYVTWAVYGSTANRIMLGRSASAGAIAGSWVIDATGPTGIFNLSTTYAANDMQTMTVPIARYNSVKNKIMVVWNERESTDTKAHNDVYYAEKGPSGWSTWGGVNKLKVSNEASPCLSAGLPATTDQLRPTLDFDGSGKATIAYYDRQRDCANNDRYDVYFTQLTVNSSAVATVAQAPTLLSTFTSDVSENQNRIGEYFDIWCETAVCYTAWIGTPNAQGDVFVTAIQ